LNEELGIDAPTERIACMGPDESNGFEFVELRRTDLPQGIKPRWPASEVEFGQFFPWKPSTLGSLIDGGLRRSVSAMLGRVRSSWCNDGVEIERIAPTHFPHARRTAIAQLANRMMTAPRSARR